MDWFGEAKKLADTVTDKVQEVAATVNEAVETAKNTARNNVKGTTSTQKALRDKSKLNLRGDVNSTKAVPQHEEM